MHKLLLGFTVLLSVLSCNASSGDTQMKAVNGKWNKKTEQKFSFDIKDAQNAKNIIFVVRNNDDYLYSNLRLIVSLTDDKNKKLTVDTLNCVLANPNGEWLGKGFGATKEVLFPYKAAFRFPGNSRYNLGVIQAMREDNLKGIEDIGVKIETAKP